MATPRTVGRILGILLLVQLAGLIVPFVLLHPLTTAPSEFMANPGAHSSQVRLAVFLLFANCALTIGIAIVTLPLFRQYSYSMAHLLVAVSVIMFSMQAIDNAHLLSMLSLRELYAGAGGPDDHFQGVATIVRSTRRWVHYTELLAIDAWIFIFYIVLFRFALVPRPLSIFGLLTVVLHFSGIVLPFFLGYRSLMLLGPPMALSHVALALWLVTKGLGERLHPARADVGIT